MRYFARLLHTPSLRHANGMDCNIIVHKLTVILIFTELDSRQFKPFSKASQGNNLRNNVMEARFILFRVTNPVDLMVRQMDVIGNVLQQLFGVGVGNILLSQLRSNSKRYSKSRTIFFWRNLSLNTVIKICMKCEQEILTLAKWALQHVFHKAET